ncbi:TIGR03936 family radical SAM-associated protein [Propioniciclava soli]|uniref:TIGR03936 family radical SAM-associated protein n=1 Tax=Propioniciclava soli TaxID=2775081 RepID=A0ABZ3C3B5_9ACTN
MTPRQQPEQQAPPVQKLHVRYAKRGRARFASHRDFSRAFERALRRADVPMAYSSGFNPHPRVSFANAAPTGAASEAEYLEIGLRERRDPDAVGAALAAALPDGLAVVDVAEAVPGGLAERLTASHWRIDLPGADPGVLARVVAEFLAADAAPVERMTKNGVRTFDARAAVVRLTADPEGLELISAHGTPLVRPDDVVTALRNRDDEFAAGVVPVLTRRAQGEWDGERIVGPFETRPGR